MLTTRPLSASGFGSNVTPLRDDAGQPVRTAEGKIKYAVWNDGAAVLREWRAGWARVANDHLQEAGLDVRIDHRSLQDRGSKLEPNIHLGPHASGVHARTGQGAVERERERIRRENAERIRANPAELIVLASSQAAVFHRADVERIARRYLPDEAPEALQSLGSGALSPQRREHALRDAGPAHGPDGGDDGLRHVRDDRARTAHGGPGAGSPLDPDPCG